MTIGDIGCAGLLVLAGGYFVWKSSAKHPTVALCIVIGIAVLVVLALLHKLFVKSRQANSAKNYVSSIKSILPPEYQNSPLKKLNHPSLQMNGWTRKNGSGTSSVGTLKDNERFMVMMHQEPCEHLTSLRVYYDERRLLTSTGEDIPWTQMKEDTPVKVAIVGDGVKFQLFMTLPFLTFIQVFLGQKSLPSLSIYNFSIDQDAMSLVTADVSVIEEMTPDKIKSLEAELINIERAFNRALDMPKVLKDLMSALQDNLWNDLWDNTHEIKKLLYYFNTHYPEHAHEAWVIAFKTEDDSTLKSLLPLEDNKTNNERQLYAKQFATHLSDARLVELLRIVHNPDHKTLCFEWMIDKEMYDLIGPGLSHEIHEEFVEFVLSKSKGKAIQFSSFWSMLEPFNITQRRQFILEHLMPSTDDLVHPSETKDHIQALNQHLPERDLFDLVNYLDMIPELADLPQHKNVCWAVIAGKGLDGFTEHRLSRDQQYEFAQHVLSKSLNKDELSESFWPYLKQLDDAQRIQFTRDLNTSSAHPQMIRLLVETLPERPSEALFWSHVHSVIELLTHQTERADHAEIEAHLLKRLNKSSPWLPARPEDLLKNLAQVGSVATWKAMGVWHDKHHWRVYKKEIRAAREVLELRIKSQQEHQGQLSVSNDSVQGGLSQATLPGGLSSTKKP